MLLLQKVSSLEHTLLTQSKELDIRQENVYSLRDQLQVLTDQSDIHKLRLRVEIEREYKEKTNQYESQISDLKKRLAKTSELNCYFGLLFCYCEFMLIANEYSTYSTTLYTVISLRLA